MGQMIIGIAVFVLIMVVQANKASKNKGKRQPHGENFPFPNFEPVQVEEEPILPYENYEKTLRKEIKLTYKTVADRNLRETYKGIVPARIKYKMSDSFAVSSVPVFDEKNAAKSSFKEGQVEIDTDFEFDLDKAIIYSEIMHRKYQD